MTLEPILEMWKIDCVIDDLNLDLATIKCASYHSKYLELHSIAKLTLKRKNAQHAILERDKWLYFNGKMTREEMDKREWPYDPFHGMSKPLKSDMDMFIKTDPDIAKSLALIDYQKTIVETLDEIMTTIRWRHSSIRNVLEAKKFAAGC
jgi:hypothetical protein